MARGRLKEAPTGTGAGTHGRIAHGGLNADFIFANPSFNVSDWSGESRRGDRRWHYGAPTARCRRTSPARGNPQEPDRGPTGGLHGRPAGPIFHQDLFF